ncbi:fumarylacetoacetate hydrolase family protein [archaeon]|nr:fumarylacetoacetate hydrolase family protein [archaeon]
MKIGRFLNGGKVVEGRIEDGEVVTKSDERLKIKDLKYLSPVNPSKIICVGLNYVDHAKELDMELPHEPILFLKAPSAVIGHEDIVRYPRTTQKLDHEAELAIVIGKKCKEVKAEDAYDVIEGYTCFNDLTARDLQKLNMQWTRAKSFDTFAPIGPHIVTKDEIDPSNLNIKMLVNGEIRQDSNTKNLIFDVPSLIEFISEIMTLNPEDIISTGTPPGIGPVKKGDEMEVKIEGIGTLRNRVS